MGTYAPNQLITEVTYLNGSEAYKEEWSGLVVNICLVMAAETSFLLFPDGLSPGGGLDAEVDVTQL